MNKFSHKYITRLALNGLFSKKDTEKIIEGSILPDKDENQNGYVCHFYNPVTNTNYTGSEDSAKTRCIAHFGRYLINKKPEELGRAIHFLEDVCTPVHTQYEDTVDAVIRGPLHIKFEKELDIFCEESVFSDDWHLGSFKSVSDLISYCALESAKNYYLYRDKKEQATALENTYKLAIFAVEYLTSQFALNNKKIADFISIKDNENVGILIKRQTENGKYKITDLAPLSENFRLRLSGRQEILIFKKPHTGRNFVLNEIFNEEENKNV